jgi:5'-3' exonuclease
MYTYWDYIRRRWERDGGLRIDHLLLSARAPSASKTLASTASQQTRAQRTKRSQQQPLLVIDGDSFAHRAYHGIPKSIVRRGGSGAGAIVGFANFLLRLYQAERPRAVLVGWDTLAAPTYRHEKFPAYQSGRQFDDALVEQLDALPELVAACGFANAKAPGYEAMISSPPR